MLRTHGLGTHTTHGVRARMPRAMVGAVLGLVLAVAQGQSEASPFYRSDVVPIGSFSHDSTVIAVVSR